MDAARRSVAGQRADGRDLTASIGVNQNTLTHWAWRIDGERRVAGDRKQARRSRPSPPVGFVELISERIADGRFELELGGDRRLRIPLDSEPSALERLLALLETRR